MENHLNLLLELATLAMARDMWVDHAVYLPTNVLKIALSDRQQDKGQDAIASKAGLPHQFSCPILRPSGGRQQG